MPATKNVISDTIKKFDLKPGEPMKNIYGDVIEDSVVISTHAFAHTDDERKMIRIVGNNAITGDEETTTFTMEAARHFSNFAQGVLGSRISPVVLEYLKASNKAMDGVDLTNFGPSPYFSIEGLAAVNRIIEASEKRQ